MKVISIAAAGVSLVLIGLTLTPAAGDYRSSFAVGALVCAAVALATIVAGWRERPAQAVESPPAIITPPPAKAVSSEVEVVALLATFQEKGRLVDFLQDDITGYSDAQVGAAARVVHQGCKAVLDEYFRILPVRDDNEGAKVIVPAGYAADEYRLVGKIGGQPPFSGTLMHRGWKAASVRLPRVLNAGNDRLPTIAPAEVELR